MQYIYWLVVSMGVALNVFRLYMVSKSSHPFPHSSAGGLKQFITVSFGEFVSKILSGGGASGVVAAAGGGAVRACLLSTLRTAWFACSACSEERTRFLSLFKYVPRGILEQRPRYSG